VPAPQLSYYEFADFSIKVNGRALPMSVALAVTEVVIDENLDWPAMFTFDVQAPEEGSPLPWVDDARFFAIGDSVDIRLGIGKKLTPVIEGEITALEAAFSSHGQPRLTVRGFDRAHRLLRGRNTRTFVNCKDSEIARQMALAAGLDARIEDSEVTLDFVVQVDRSDWDLLRERARAIGFDLLVRGRALVFRPRTLRAPLLPPLQLGRDLFEFLPRISTAGQVTAVTAHGGTLRDNKQVEAVARSSTLVPPAEVGAPALVKKAFGDAAEVLSMAPKLGNDVELAKLGQARLNEVAFGLVQADAVCAGRPELHAGEWVGVQGVGRRFGGNYLIASARHRCGGESFTTHLQLRRASL
jgi:uncharacterized protein